METHTLLRAVRRLTANDIRSRIDDLHRERRLLMAVLRMRLYGQRENADRREVPRHA